MKRIIAALALAAACLSQTYAQDLSQAGYKNWVTAVALMEEAKTATDYFEIIDLFGSVTQSDPAFADAYYNLGILMTRLAGMGGGLPAFECAERYYNRYLSLRPADRVELTKAFVQIDIRRKSFLKDFGPKMKLIEKGTYNDKAPVTVEGFWIQSTVFSLADYKETIPVANEIHRRLAGSAFDIPAQESPDGKDNVPYIANYPTAENVVALMNYITGRHYFIPRFEQWHRVVYVAVGNTAAGIEQLADTGIYVGGWYKAGANEMDLEVIEWVDNTEEGLKYCIRDVSFPLRGNGTVERPAGLKRYFPPEISKVTKGFLNTYVTAFRMACPAGEM